MFRRGPAGSNLVCILNLPLDCLLTGGFFYGFQQKHNATCCYFTFNGRIIMKQKYLLLKDMHKNQLIIQEFAELDKESMSLLCEEAYNNQEIEAAIVTGNSALMQALRTVNMYPPNLYAQKIAESVKTLYGPDGGDAIELLFDDTEFLCQENPPEIEVEDIEDESDDIDSLLEDELDDEDKIVHINSSLKVADDEILDIDDET